jgi:hypothetical protein
MTVVPVGQQQVHYPEEIRVEGGFAAQETDAVPPGPLFPALGHEVRHVPDGQGQIARRLGAGPVAVAAPEVAPVGDVHLDIPATPVEGPAQTPDHGPLTADELEKIRR